MNSRTTWLNKFILTILTSFLISTSLLAGNYTWNGGTSTAWGTSTNWTPNGTPSTNDTVTTVSYTHLYATLKPCEPLREVPKDRPKQQDVYRTFKSEK